MIGKKKTDNEDFYPSASEDFFGEKPAGTTVPDFDKGNSSRIGCMSVVVIIIVGMLAFVLL